MPIYEYVCRSCGCRFDRRFSSVNVAQEQVTCPGCDGEDVQWFLSAPAVPGSRRPSGPEIPEVRGPSNPPPFGRQELTKALANKGRLVYEL